MGNVVRVGAQRRPLCLIEGTTVAGTRHVAGIRDIAEGYEPGERFVLRRDLDNMYDEWAVKVFDRNNVRIGYVSCECNEIVARLIDGGRRVFACFEGVAQVESWTRIEMGVYLND